MIQDLNDIGIQFSQTVRQISLLNNDKKQFSKGINYQIQSLFELICPFSTASFSQLSISLGSMAAEVLIKNKKCFTPENLCEYLGIGEQGLKKNLWVQNKLDEQIKQQFKRIILREMEITKKLREYMKKVDIDKLFNEIDFFGNGYVDSASLSEFICHYNKNGYEQIEKECLHIIKVLKDSASATKLFFQDFYTFIQSSKSHRNEIDVSEIQKKRKVSHNFGSQKRTIGHIAKISEWSNLNVSMKTQNIQKINAHNNTVSEVRYILTQEELRDVDYETKLINAHPRNKKYIQKVKKELQVNYLPQYSFSAAKKLISPLQRTQLLFKLKSLSELYYKQSQEIRNFFIENPKFTFLNGFNVIDQKQMQKVTEAEFYDFISDQKINVQHKKVEFFFSLFCKGDQSIIKYHNYVKIFLMNVFKWKQFNDWMRRKPILGQKWPQKMKNNYCKVLRRLINFKYQQKQDKDHFRNIIKQLNKELDYDQILITMFDDAKIHKDKMINILGEKAQPFILQLYGENTLLQTDRFIEFFR